MLKCTARLRILGRTKKKLKRTCKCIMVKEVLVVVGDSSEVDEVVVDGALHLSGVEVDLLEVDFSVVEHLIIG